MEKINEKNEYNISLDVNVYFTLHYLDNNEEFSVSIYDFNCVNEKDGKTVVYYGWDDEGMYFPNDEVTESVDEVNALYKEACNLKDKIYDTHEIVEVK